MFETTHLQRHFDELSDKKWTLLSFNSEFSQSLLESAKIRLQRSQFRDAQLAAEQKVVPQVRNDQIFWLDAKLNALNEAEKEFLNWLNDFCHQLRTDLRVSLREVECHYAYYDKGHFYQKHRDVTSVHNKRVISFVLYLNPNWKT